jgi:hypothetical protein
LETGLELIKNKIQNGIDIRSHQSRLLKKIDNKDGLFFDWDIHHLHLGRNVESDGFINRTGPLLYPRFDDQYAYFLTVESHCSWTMLELLKIIHRNWPQSIKNVRIKDANSLSTNFSDQALKNLSSAQINALIEVAPGAIYIGPGSGIVSSGDSAKAVMDKLEQRNELMKLEYQLINNTKNSYHQYLRI